MKLHTHFLTVGIVFLSTLVLPVCMQKFDSNYVKSFQSLFDGIFEQEDLNFTTSGSHLVPPPRPFKWMALGDSFAAGPGAGDAPDDDDVEECQRGRNAYPYQMQADRKMPGPSRGQKPEFLMMACTGDQTKHMLDEDNQNYQLGPIGPAIDFVTLSIGGNDVSFSGILQACVFGTAIGKSCDDALQHARDVLYGPAFHDRYIKVLQKIVDQMRWTERPRTAIFVTSYSQFFDVYTTQCNNAKFLSVAGHLISQDLRRKLNTLLHEVNFVLQYWIDLFNYRYTVDVTGDRDVTPVSFANVDQFYNKHRFCRDGVEEPDSNNADTFFFHMYGYDGEGNTIDEKQFKDKSDEDLAKMAKEHYSEPIGEPGAKTLPISIVKSFHPTTPGFRMTTNVVFSKLLFKYLAQQQTRAGQYFDVMVVGDYVPYASQDPNSDIFQGFIPHLKAIFRNPEFYGWGYNDPVLRPQFIGDRLPPSGNPEYHSTWEHDKIDDLVEHVKESQHLKTRGKIVLLMAGHNDLLLNYEVDTIQDRVKRLIDTILDGDKDAVILLSQLPLYGFESDGNGKTWGIIQRRFVDYNAMLAELANEYETRGWGKVFIVHAATTPLEHRRGDPILPDAAGYRRLAYDFAEAIITTGAHRWWQGRRTEEIEENSKRSPAPESDEPEPGKVKCYSREVFVKQGSKEEIRDSILQHMDIDDYIEKIGCNRTEICKISDDGLHGDKVQPIFLNRNATACARQGGKPGIPDYNIVRINMPAGDYNLEGSACGDMMKKIMDECIMKDDVAGELTNEDGLYVGFMPSGTASKVTDPITDQDKFYDNKEFT